MIVHGYRPTPNALVLSRSGPMGERCMKDTVHPSVHPSVHQQTCISVQTRRLCTSNSTQFGRGQNTVLGWSDPHFSGARAAKTLWGRSSPTVCPSRSGQMLERSDGPGFPDSEEGKKCLLHLWSYHVFTFGSNICHALSKFPRQDVPNSPRAKPQNRAGATQDFRLSAAQKFSGSLPPDVLWCALLGKREKVLSNKSYAAPRTTCPTRLHDERRRVLVALKGTT
jgi:hypothetical protein